MRLEIQANEVADPATPPGDGYFHGAAPHERHASAPLPTQILYHLARDMPARAIMPPGGCVVNAALTP